LLEQRRVQTCIVHLIRYSMQFASWKESRRCGRLPLNLTLLTGKHRYTAMKVLEMAHLGGKARAPKLTAKKRPAIARKAALKRWRKWAKKRKAQ
jgi:transposase-like protein